LITLFTEPKATSVITVNQTTETEPIVPVRRGLSLLGKVLSPETALHQSVICLADQGVASATNFLTGVIIARACSKEELGLYMLGFSVVLFMMDLQTSLITTPYMVYSPRLKGRAHALYTGSTLIHQSTFCLLAMLGLVCGAIVVTHGVGPRGLGPVLWALVLVVALIMLREHARRVSFARLRFTTAFIFDLGIAVCQIGGLLVLARLRLLSASRAYWVVGAVCGTAVLAWLWSDRGFYHPRFKESLVDLKNNWALAKWVFASGVVWTISMNLYPWLLAIFHGAASVGVWAACVGVVSIGNTLLLGIQNLVGPKVAHKYAAEGLEPLRHLVIKICAILAVLLLPLSLVLMFYGGPLVALLYGRQYGGHNAVVAVMAVNLVVTAAAFSFSRALFAVERAEVDFWANAAGVVIMASAGIWMVRHYGPLGAAVGLLAANSAAWIVKTTFFLRLSSHVVTEQGEG
jgi:O-antigen/teichoic acid export membrane protein